MSTGFYLEWSMGKHLFFNFRQKHLKTSHLLFSATSLCFAISVFSDSIVSNLSDNSTSAVCNLSLRMAPRSRSSFKNDSNWRNVIFQVISILLFLITSHYWLLGKYWGGLGGLIYINPWHSNISMHILHSILCTFPRVLTRRICSMIKSFISWW